MRPTTLMSSASPPRWPSRAGDLTEYEGRPLEALPHFQRAHELSVEQARVQPSPDATYRIALTLSLVAQHLAIRQRFPEALAKLHEGNLIIDRLLVEFPNSPLYARQRMTLAHSEGSLYDDEANQTLQQPAASVALCRRSLALAQAQADADKSTAGARLSPPSPSTSALIHSRKSGVPKGSP